MEARPKPLSPAAAIATARQFRALFPESLSARWAFADDVRRKADGVGEIVHLIEPLYDHAFAADPDKAVLGQHAPVNLVWRQLDLLLAAGEVRQQYMSHENPFAWHEHFRCIVHAGIPHHLLISSGNSWGLALFAATGPRPYVRQMWARLEEYGYRIRPGLRLTSNLTGRTEKTPTEESLYDIAGLPFIEPEHRGVATAAKGKQPSRRREGAA